MNHYVKNWTVSREDSIPDSIQIDGENRVMAQRKKPQTEFVKDSSSADGTNKRLTHLSKNHFNNVVRFVKTAELEAVKQLRSETYNNLKRLNLKRDLSACPVGIPKGSDQVDVGTLIRFLRGIEETHEKAVQQLIALDAACCKRFE